MIREAFDSIPLWLSLPVTAAAGLVLGIVYFRLIGVGVRLVVDSDRPVVAVAIGVGRFVVLAGALLLISLCGALALGTATAGLLTGRFITLRRMKEADAWNHH